MDPAGWIPPEFREFVYAELDGEDLKAVQQTVRIHNLDTGEEHHPDAEEVAEMGVRRIIGVTDTRDGSYHPNKYFKGEGGGGDCPLLSFEI